VGECRDLNLASRSGCVCKSVRNERDPDNARNLEDDHLAGLAAKAEIIRGLARAVPPPTSSRL